MEEIGLQELIDQVKRELLAPTKDPDPLFFIEKIELEMSVKVTKSGDGNIKVTVLGFLQGGVDASIAHERNNVVKVSISPLLERDEIIRKIKEDPTKFGTTMRASQKVFLKGDGVEEP